MLPRRKFIFKGLMGAFLLSAAASIIQLCSIVLQYLYPQKKEGRWLFVAAVDKLKKGMSFPYVSPSGQSILISRTGNSGKTEDFTALSDICPHLGCKVFWQPTNKTFFCPCHNGRFDSAGVPMEGPPAKADQQLISFPLRIRKNLLYIRISSESLLKISKMRKRHSNCSHGVTA